MSQERNIKWLNDRRVFYRCDPWSDKPTIETDLYKFYEHGTHQCYTLFASKAKITTYKSLKWHMLVIYFLNIDGVDGDTVSFEDDMRSVFRFIANKDNGFVTFYISNKALEDMIEDVLYHGGDPPINKMRKVIFKPASWSLSLSEKLSIVGKLIGRKKVTKDEIYSMMLEANDRGAKITISYLATLLRCSTRTIYRHMCDDLKKEKQRLNEEV
jgi:hypothetical protein